jgi:hypothetical protein
VVKSLESGSVLRTPRAAYSFKNDEHLPDKNDFMKAFCPEIGNFLGISSFSCHHDGAGFVARCSSGSLLGIERQRPSSQHNNLYRRDSKVLCGTGIRQRQHGA